MRASDRLGHGGQGLVDLAVVFETVAQNLNLQGLAFVPAGEDGAGQGQVAVDERAGLSVPWDWSRSRLFLPRRRQTQVGVLGQLRGAPSRPFGQIPLGQGLQAPDDALDQPGFVAYSGLFSKNLCVL